MANTKNKSLLKAKSDKNDEFYTQMKDVELELSHYKQQFENKTVYCNCDNPLKSNFVRFLIEHFNEFHLKRLLATHYLPVSLFEQNDVYKLDVSLVDSDVENVIKNNMTLLKGDGDYKSKECLDILEQVDIITTNPPFSLLKDFIYLLMEKQKKFLIIGNKNIIGDKKIFQWIKDDQLRMGYSTHHMKFILPESYEKKKIIYSVKKDNVLYSIVFGLTCWFTNLDVNNTKWIKLTKTYNQEEFPKYDNYDAINVDEVNNIPIDYNGYIGVPITFIDKYNPKQFEIIDCIGTRSLLGTSSKHNLSSINGKLKYNRIIIKNKA